MRFDHNVGTLPAQSTPGGPFVAGEAASPSRRRSSRTSPSGAPDLSLRSDGATARPRSRRATAATACRSGSIACSTSTRCSRLRRPAPWTDPNNDGIAQSSEIGTGCSGFPSTTSHYAGANGPRLAVLGRVHRGHRARADQEHARRRDVLPPHQPRSDRHAQHRRADAAPTRRSRFRCPTARTARGSPKPDRDGLQPACRRSTACRTTSSTTIRILNTDYNGVEFTAQQAVLAALADGGRLHGRQEHRRHQHRRRERAGSRRPLDLNDPNNTLAYAKGIVGNDSLYAFRLSGSYRAPLRDPGGRQPRSRTPAIPFMSTYSVTRAAAAAAGVALTRCDADDFPERARRRAATRR